MYSFWLYDRAGTPVAGAAPVFTAYRTIASVDRVPPTITNRHSNYYSFTPTPADIVAGVGFMIDADPTVTNGAVPRFFAGGIGGLAAFGVWDSASGLPKTDAVPVIDTYLGGDNTVFPNPVVTNIGLGVYGWVPAPADYSNDVQFKGNTVSVGASPRSFEGFVAAETGGGGGTGPTLLSTTSFGTRVDLIFSAPLILGGAAAIASQWVFGTSTPGAALPVSTSVSVAGATISVYMTEDTAGAIYSLQIPPTGITDLGSTPFEGPWTTGFTGVGIAPFVALAGAEDGLHARVIFSEAVREAEALVPGNYVITGGAGLSVYAVQKETDLVYRLTTSLQVSGQLYTVTVSGLYDLAGNAI